VTALLENDTLADGDISWSGHHAESRENVIRPKAKIALLPPFQESAHTVSMVKHGMKIVRGSIGYLNPGQTPVITMDQPLYSLTKQIQWENQELFLRFHRIIFHPWFTLRVS
jgi:hypothetical protein